MRILVIEDDRRLAELIVKGLTLEGFQTDLATDGTAGLDLALRDTYDAIVLDRMLPGLDGIELLTQIRSEHVSTPTLMLTARADLRDRVDGLDAGADDYLAKPFAFDELFARLRALVRRRDRPITPNIIEIGPVAFDPGSGALHYCGNDVRLTRQESDLLLVLARSEGTVLTKDRLLERVWGYDSDPRGNVVELYIHYIRQKLDRAHPGTGKAIVTVRGKGYRLVPLPIA